MIILNHLHHQQPKPQKPFLSPKPRTLRSELGSRIHNIYITSFHHVLLRIGIQGAKPSAISYDGRLIEEFMEQEDSFAFPPILGCHQSLFFGVDNGVPYDPAIA